MPYPEDQDDQLVILDLADDSVVAHTNAQLAVTALQLDASGRTGVTGERADRIEQSTGCRLVELPDGSRR